MSDTQRLESVCQSLAISNESLSETVADFLAEASNLAGMNGSGDNIRRRILKKLGLAKDDDGNGR